VLRAGDLAPRDRVLLTLPLWHATAQDCLAAVLDCDVLTLPRADPSLVEMRRFEPTVLIATPSEALRLGQAAAEQRVDLEDGSVRLVVVCGEPGGSLGSTRRRIEDAFGARVLDVYALTELGVVGWSCLAGGGVHLDEAAFRIEALAPDGEGDAAVVDGDLGELTVTTLDQRGVSFERYRTGDLVRLRRTPCACGTTNVLAEGGILGRRGERLLVRGVELLPSSIEQVVRRHPAVVEYHLLVYQVRAECEVAVQLEVQSAVASEGDLARVAAEVGEDLRRSLGVRLEVELVAPGSLRAQDAGRRARRLSRQ
jgi:phenylacetate-CoA ligase